MVNHRTKKEEVLSPPDEAWWAALLADEERCPEPLGGRTRSEVVSFPAFPAQEQTLRNEAARNEAVDWQQIQRLFEMDETLSLRVSGFNRGGLLVEGDGVHGFVPISHLVDVNGELPDLEREQVLNDYIGRVLYVKVIECDPERGRVVFSERAALASSGKRNQLLGELRPGICVEGVVTNITDFGVFVDLGGVEGLIHVSEISWGRVRHPGDAVQLGERVTTYVIQVDKDRSRIALSLKRLCSNPWDTAELRYHPGQVVDAIVTSVVPFGAFARLEEGLDGLIHISEMGPDEFHTNPTDRLQEGQPIQVRVLHIDASRQRLGLSLNLEAQPER